MPENSASAPPRILTAEELAEFGLEPLGPCPPELTHPYIVESEARRAARVEREARNAAAPTAALRRLLLAPDGASVLFTQYKRASQLSALIQIVKDEAHVQFSCRREYSLIDGSVAGVRVTKRGAR